MPIDTFSRLKYRLSPDGLSGLPLNVRSTGHYRVSRGFSEDSEPKWFFEIFWTLSGNGSFHLGDHEFPVKAGSVFLYYPGECHQLSATRDHWEYYWFTLDGREVMNWLGGFNLKRISHDRTCPEKAFTALNRSMDENTLPGELEASAIAYSILLKAAHPVRVDRPELQLAARAREILDKDFIIPGLQVEGVARQLKTHRSTLNRQFMNYYGVSPSQYLINRRLQFALSQLKERSASIQEVCYASGFSDPNYFSRLVRQRTGLTPTKFRAS